MDGCDGAGVMDSGGIRAIAVTHRKSQLELELL